MVKVDMNRGMKILEITIDGEVKKISKSTISKAMSYTNRWRFEYNGNDEHVKETSQRIEFLANIVKTNSVKRRYMLHVPWIR